MTSQELNIILELNKHRFEIEKSIEIDEQTNFFTSQNKNSFYKSFLNETRDTVNNPDGFNRFLLHFKFPMEISEIINNSFEQLKKIFYAEDRHIEIEKKEQFNIEFYSNLIFELYKNSPNAKIYFAYSDNQKKYIPKIIKSRQVLEYELDGDSFNYIIIGSQNQILYFDKNIIQIYEKDKSKAGKLLQELKNNAAIVPFFFVSNKKLNIENQYVRTNNIYPLIPKLANIQRLEVFKKIMSPYAFFLFATKYKPDICNYSDPVRGVECEGGYLVDTKTKQHIFKSYENGYVRLEKCPKCNSDLGIGNQISMGILKTAQNASVLENPLAFIAPPTNTMEYSDKFLQEKRKDIYNSILGIEQQLNENVANTAEAYHYNTVSREQILFNLKTDFEKIINNIQNGLLKLKGYKDPQFYINLGSKFLVSSLNSLYANLNEAKKSNLAEVLGLKEQIIMKKFENDKANRMRALVLLDFYPDFTPKELALIPPSDLEYQKQIYFKPFVKWFENNINEIKNYNSKQEALKVLELNFVKYINQKN